MDTSDKATADRLRRVYAGESVPEVYGEYITTRPGSSPVTSYEAAHWWMEQDERAAVQSWLAMMEQRDQKADAAIDDAVQTAVKNFKDYGEVM